MEKRSTARRARDRQAEADPLSASGVALRLFVVENHPDTREGIQQFLRSLGHHVTVFESMAETLHGATRLPCDVLLSDLSLPDGNGWDLLRTLAQRGQRPRHAIAMSGLGTAADLKRSREAGFTLHLVKPFHPTRLADVLHSIAADAGAAEREPAEPSSPLPAQWRQRLHDGLCQQLAAGALLQAALVQRLVKAADATSAGQGEAAFTAWPVVVAEARHIEEVLHTALDELRAFMQDGGAAGSGQG